MKPLKLTFNSKIAKQKPNNDDQCPFCHTEHLGKILEQKDDMIWVENKYPVMEDTYPTLIIESSWHEGDIPFYTREVNRKLFAYATGKWQEMSCQ